jgi:N-acetylglucosaminyl-diphospho-decaprenol L-rhamnosyltransferase
VTPDLSAIVVSHATSAEAAACVASLSEAFAREGVRGEIVLVDCASDEDEQALLKTVPANRTIFLADNRGYSGGANAGLAAAHGSKLLVCNADVVFHPGAVAALADSLEVPARGAVGPLCVWDEKGLLLLPPGFAPSFLGELAQVRGGGGFPLGGRRFAAFARQTRRLWRQGGRARHLSGAVLAARRDVFDRVGRFDERFPFEYEETEWEDRVRAAGLELWYEPGARVRHLWGSSSSRNSGTASRRSASRREYRNRRYGRIGRLLLERAARERPEPAPRLRLERGAPPSFAPRPGAFLALSPNPSGLPFAGASLETGFEFPREVLDRLSGRWYLTIFRGEDGRPLDRMAWERA